MTMTDLVLTEELEAILAEHAEVVCKTDGMERELWFKTRKPHLGASEAATSLGLSPYDSRMGLFVNKTTDAPSQEDNDYLRWGRRLEEAIGLGISEDTGIPVVRYPYMLKSRQWPFMAANLDFLAPRSVVEVKNVSQNLSREWADGAVPAHIGIQGQHQCAITGLPGVHFFPLIGGHEGRPVYVERNDALIEKLIEGERAFWDLVEANTPPEIDDTEATTRALKSLFVDPDAESRTELGHLRDSGGNGVAELLEHRALAKAVVKEQEGIITEIENQLFLWLGNYEIGLVNGEVRFTWKKQFRSGYTVAPTSFRKIHVPKPASSKTKKRK